VIVLAEFSIANVLHLIISTSYLYFASFVAYIFFLKTMSWVYYWSFCFSSYKNLSHS
jgi:hypothetical protein